MPVFPAIGAEAGGLRVKGQPEVQETASKIITKKISKRKSLAYKTQALSIQRLLFP